MGNILSHQITTSFSERILMHGVSGVLLLAFLIFTVQEKGILNPSDLQVLQHWWPNFDLEVTVWKTQMWTALTCCYNSELQSQFDFTCAISKCNALPGRLCMCHYKSATHGQMICAQVPLQQRNTQSIKIEMSWSLSWTKSYYSVTCFASPPTTDFLHH